MSGGTRALRAPRAAPALGQRAWRRLPPILLAGVPGYQP